MKDEKDPGTLEMFSQQKLGNISERIARKSKPLTPIQRRLILPGPDIATNDDDELAFQHTVFCQASLPYRDPEEQRRWQRQQGGVLLEVEAGRILNPRRGELVDVGLPYGPKPRLVLAFLNTTAIQTGNPVIDVGHSFTAFTRRILGYNPNGREGRLFKDQLNRLSAATLRLAILRGSRAAQINAQIVTAFSLWFEKDDRQRVLWPSEVRLSQEYFDSLHGHAVPLSESALGKLSHTAMGLDVYSWLAQRLHRVPPGKPQFVPWVALHQQFGWHYERVRKFREVFRQTLRTVKAVYPDARFDVDGQGMRLWTSPPPVAKRLHALPPAQKPGG